MTQVQGAICIGQGTGEQNVPNSVGGHGQNRTIGQL